MVVVAKKKKNDIMIIISIVGTFIWINIWTKLNGEKIKLLRHSVYKNVTVLKFKSLISKNSIL